jgi:hypothetical protein
MPLSNIIPVDSSDNNESVMISSVEAFNNVHIAPRLSAITDMDYFRYVKLNLKKKCTLWADDTKCALRDCSIKFCEEADLPSVVDMERRGTDNGDNQEDCPSSSPEKLAQVEYTISAEHEDTLDSLFQCSESDLEGGEYIDLQLNPERYTGYAGESAHRIWRSIYEENCFFKNGKSHNPFSLDNVCYEERVFYRAISGLHSSINIHLCAEYALMDGSFTFNPQEFVRRFKGKENFLSNLYFLYLLELRALQKSEQYLLSNVNWQSSGDLATTKDAIKNLLKTLRNFKWHFNESKLFKQDPKLAHDFAHKFRNITSEIMDCVACDKCKLWGKVQIHGLGTAFKILLTKDESKIQLTRHEIITLVNALCKLSKSIRYLDQFEKELSQTKSQVKKPIRNGYTFI